MASLIPPPEETRAQNAAPPIPMSGGYIATPSYTAPSAIGSAQLTPQAPIVLPPQNQPTNPQTTNVSIPTPQQIVQTPTTDAEMKQTEFLNKIAGLTGSKQSLATLQTNQENAKGVPALTKNLNDLASQIEGLNNQATALSNEANYTIPNQAQESATGKGMTTGGLAPLTASQLRQNQIKQGAIATQSLTLKSAYYAANGQYLLAKDAADKAAQVQFDAQQNEIDTAKAQLDAIAPTLNKEEKQRAAIQAAQLQDRQTQIENGREDFKAGQALAINTIKNYPDNAQAQLAAQQVMKLDPNSKDYLNQVFNLIGKYQSDPVALQNSILEQQAKRAQIAVSYANLKKINAEIADMSLPPVTSPEAGKYTGALSVILGSGKFTKDQKKSIITSVNGGEDPVAVLKNQAKQVMTGANQTKVESYETAQDSLKSVAANLDAYYAAGGTTDIFKGKFESFINKNLGTLKDAKLVELATQIQQSLQIYRNAVSGTAYSVQEGADIASIFPGIYKTEMLNNAIIAGRMKAFNDGIDGAYKGVLGSTYESIKSPQNQGADQYSSFRAQLKPGEILINRNGKATAILPNELKPSDVKL